MKYLPRILLTTFLLLIGSKAAATDLAKYEVNHFQLLVNNLKMLYISQQSPTPITEGDITNMFTHFYGTTENNLIVDIFLKAPFKKVSRESCNTELKRARDNFIDKEKVLYTMIKMASYYDLKPHQVNEVVNSTKLQVTLSALENDEFIVTCTS